MGDNDLIVSPQARCLSRNRAVGKPEVNKKNKKDDTGKPVHIMAKQLLDTRA
jgi:hypothetical protein